MTRVELQLQIMKLLQAGPMTLDQIKVGAVMPVHMKEAMRVLCDLNFVAAKTDGSITIYHAVKRIAKTKRGEVGKHICIKDKVLDFVENSGGECTAKEVHEATGASRHRCSKAMDALVGAGALEYRLGLDRTGRRNTRYWRVAGLEVIPIVTDSIKTQAQVLEVISTFESTAQEIADAIGKTYAVTYHKIKVLQKAGDAFIVDRRVAANGVATNVWSSKPLGSRP